MQSFVVCSLKSRLCRGELPIVIGRLGASRGSGAFVSWEHLIHGITLFRKRLGSGHESEWPEVEVFGRRLCTDYQQEHQGPGSMLKVNRCACCCSQPGWFKEARRIRRSSYLLYAR